MPTWIDILLPRFIDELVVMKEAEEAYVPDFPVRLLDPNETPRYVIRIRSFNAFGIALFPRAVGEMRRFREEDRYGY